LGGPANAGWDWARFYKSLQVAGAGWVLNLQVQGRSGQKVPTYTGLICLSTCLK